MAVLSISRDRTWATWLVVYHRPPPADQNSLQRRLFPIPSLRAIIRLPIEADLRRHSDDRSLPLRLEDEFGQFRQHAVAAGNQPCFFIGDIFNREWPDANRVVSRMAYAALPECALRGPFPV